MEYIDGRFKFDQCYSLKKLIKDEKMINDLKINDNEEIFGGLFDENGWLIAGKMKTDNGNIFKGVYKYQKNGENYELSRIIGEKKMKNGVLY